MPALQLSTFLDYAGYRITNASTVEQAYGFSDGSLFNNPDNGFNMALVLQRQQDPTELLSGNWASRQQALAQLNASGALWSTYGADLDTFNSITAQLAAAPYGFTLLNSSNSNYVSSPESRTIWITINSSAQFQALFGTELYYSPSQGLAYWNGLLSVPESWPIAGLWIDISTVPNPSNFTQGVSATLPQGPQSPGNSTASPPQVAPQTIASDFYNFPLAGQLVATGTIGLIEPNIGTGLPDDPGGTTFATKLQEYLQVVGQTTLSGTVDISVQGISGQQANSSRERSLDVGIVAAVNPNSPLIFYNGSGETKDTGYAQATVFTAAQSAAWDTINQPQVTTNSWGDPQSMTPGSPFYNAYWGIFEDAALNNQTTVIALGDGGSGNETGNGLTNVEINVTQPYNLLVSGTSLSSLASALADPTLSTASGSLPALTDQALARDPATLWQLMQAGLTQMPSEANLQDRFLEVVWNSYEVNGTEITGDNSNWITGFLNNSTASGGVDPSQATPPVYQVNYGLSPVTADPLAQSGRGVPDVSANAGGNLYYAVPNGYFGKDPKTGQFILASGTGTSSAAPFWASLIVQLNAIFEDQGLPQLGYMNDLLYTASVVSPAAFNDIQDGNNNSSFYIPGPYSTPSAKGLQPTNFGYEATPGYDLVTGLGSPNGTRLAIALTNIAHAQLSTAAPVPVFNQNGSSAAVSGAEQTLQFQVSSPGAAPVAITVAGTTSGADSPASAGFAWTSQLAQQSLQDDFDADLLRLFDGASQGVAFQSATANGAAVQVQLAGNATSTPQINLSAAYGFVDFSNAAGVVRASRPVSVATTPQDADDAEVVVRMRQNGVDSIAVFFYQVDSLTGSINGIAPGQAGYGAAAQARRYQFSNGETDLQGAGFGNYSQGVLQGVDSGDLIAMGLVNQSYGQTFWGFADANETIAENPVNHLWNYGMNVFGFEDTFGGGDRDFQDAVVELDYGSASGHGWLLNPASIPS